MKQTRSLMGMHITVEITDENARTEDIDTVYAYFSYIDGKFSTYKKTSEISQINTGKIKEDHYSVDMKTIFTLSEQTKNETHEYFDILHGGKIDPSGLVKGWAIYQASKILEERSFENFYIDAGGDVQVAGKNMDGKPWIVGIRNPFSTKEIVKVLSLNNKGVATSGTSIRGQHIYNPHKPTSKITEIVSMTVIGPNVYEADRFATASFAMGLKGIHFIEKLSGFEGYMIDRKGIATYTSEFNKYVVSDSNPMNKGYNSL